MSVAVRSVGWLAALVLAGCATGEPPRGSTTESNIVANLEEAAAASAPAPAEPPEEVTQALIPEVETPLPGPELALEERFDVNVNNAEAREFFMALVADTPYNVVVHPEVGGRISLTLKNVTVQEVLEVVRDVYGYDFRGSAAGYIVLPATLQTRIFQINYLNITREGHSRTRISSGSVSENGSRTRDRGSDRDGQAFRSGRDRQVELTGAAIDTRSKASFWDDLHASLTAIIGEGDGRKVVLNAQTGVIMVTAMPGELRDVEDYLESVQAMAQRQVVLEAKIMEVDLRDGFQAGINWGVFTNDVTGGIVSPTGQQGLLEGDVPGDTVEIGDGLKLDTLAVQRAGGALVISTAFGDFSALIELLQAQGDLRVLSSPRVATLNNQKAVIKAGFDEYFVTDIDSDVVTGTATSQSRDIELTPFFSGVALDVTPQVAADGSVILHVHPTISDVTEQDKNITLTDETDTVPLAFSRVRETDTVVRAKSGQIIVIGGLMANSTEKQRFGAPVLSDIPGVGALFRSTREVERRTELVILLKPLVMEDDSDWSGLVADPLRRVRDMERGGPGG